MSDAKEDQEETPNCPECGGDLEIAWTIPQIGHLREICTFKCTECKSLFSDHGEQDQPLRKLQF
jgi:C4-type Zn-finger protein